MPRPFVRHAFSTTLLLAAIGLSPAVRADEPRGPTPSYTDADLARYAATRTPASTSSEPESASPPPATRTRGRKAAIEPGPAADLDREASQRASDERYWRREAEQARERARKHEDQAATLEAQVVERRQSSRRSRSGAAAPQLASLERRARLARERAREILDAFEERARRAGALPGWIR